LKDTEHILAFEVEREVVGEQMDLQGVWVLLNDLEIEDVQDFREEFMLRFINVDFIYFNGSPWFLVFF
jgi:FPC/CPF motif-containing protein YcgG